MISAACADLPSAPTAEPGDKLADCRWLPDGSVACDPVEPIWDGPPECDPYLTLGGCDDNCEMSEPGVDDPEYVGLAGCNDTGTGPGPGDPFDPGGGGAPPPPPPTETEQPDTCRTADPTVDDPAVQAAFTQLWANSNPTAVQSDRREQAAWVVQTQWGLDIIPWTNADFGPCSISPHYGSFSIPTNAVAWIHTHPFTVGEVQTSCDPIAYTSSGAPIYGRYSSFPNDRDVAMGHAINSSLGRNIPAYTIDQSTIYRFTATGETTAIDVSNHTRCGY